MALRTIPVMTSQGRLTPGDPDPTELGRCDRCPAQALVQLIDDHAATLDFCGHHYTVRYAALAAAGWSVVIDRRSDLLAAAAN